MEERNSVENDTQTKVDVEAETERIVRERMEVDRGDAGGTFGGAKRPGSWETVLR